MSRVIKLKTFLPVIIVVILWIRSFKQNIVFLKQLKCKFKISGSSAATKFGVKILVTVCRSYHCHSCY